MNHSILAAVFATGLFNFLGFFPVKAEQGNTRNLPQKMAEDAKKTGAVLGWARVGEPFYFRPFKQGFPPSVPAFTFESWRPGILERVR